VHLLRGLRERPGQLSIGLAALLHAGLGLWSALAPERVLLADRAITRHEAIVTFLASDDPLRVMLHTGAPGDYIVQAMLWWLGGVSLVLIVQWAAFVSTLAVVYAAARRMDVTPGAAAVAVVGYALLATSLHQPHTLASEALFTPLVALFGYGALECLHTGRLRIVAAAPLGVAAGAAVFIRAVFLPVVPGISALLLATKSARWPAILLVNLLTIAPLASWNVVAVVHGERAELGGRGASLNSALYRRIVRMEKLGGSPRVAGGEGRVSIGQYLSYASENPVVFARLHVTDAANLLLNPGVNHTFGRFLHLFPMREDTKYWSELIEREGLVAAARELLRREPMRIVWNVVAMLQWMAFAGIGCLGLVVLFRTARWPEATALLLLIVLPCAPAFAMAWTRWSHRSPGEFGLALAFAVGWGALVKRGARKRVP